MTNQRIIDYLQRLKDICTATNMEDLIGYIVGVTGDDLEELDSIIRDLKRNE